MILGISTSLSQFCATLNNNARLIHHTLANRAVGGQSSLHALISKLLKEADIKIIDITNVVVDIGPGGTSSVRTGVSFANGLAYSLDLPVAGISSAELMGIDAFTRYKIPAAVLFKSIKKKYYCGLYDGHHLEFLYSELDQIAGHINNEYTNIVLAGHQRVMTELEPLLPDTQVIMSEIHKVDPLVFGEISGRFISGSNKYPVLPSPITELNLIQ